MQRRSSLEEFCQEGEQRNAMVGGRPGKAWLPNTTAYKKQTCGNDQMERVNFTMQKREEVILEEKLLSG